MKNAVLLAVESKITPLSRTPLSRILVAGGKSGEFGGKSGVRVSKLSGSTDTEDKCILSSICFDVEHFFWKKTKNNEFWR